MSMELEDEVVCELDVVLNSQSEGQLFLIQYPLRPRYRPYGDQGTLSSGKIGANSLQLNYTLNSSGPNYDKKSNEFNHKEQTLQSKTIVPLNDYWIGVIRENTLSLSPLEKVYQMRPAMDYVDASTKTRYIEDKDEEENLKAEKESKKMRIFKKKEAHKVEEEEKLKPVEVLDMNNESSIEAFESLIPKNCEEIEITTNSAEYVANLLPEQTKNFGFRNTLREMPISLQVEEILKKAEVISYEFLIEMLGKNDSRIDQALSQKATIIRGRWVCKSDLLQLGDSEKIRDVCLAILFSKGFLEKSKLVQSFKDLHKISSIITKIAVKEASKWFLKGEEGMIDERLEAKSNEYWKQKMKTFKKEFPELFN
ncbi:unnamed protein product [Blepharisma stoltei]|uniref:DNA-directed RNA polymerase III subunit RPC5 n=1 Tax=Blepharisma stoltei TaxID=1481888 RepID=A0AAU9IUH2_9CILI|nr:unnamed protein product [Blepharisma stoltei]